MKVKNIVFSGFMAAIMLSVTGAANAAAVEIASRKYVDDTAVPAAVTQAMTKVEEQNYLTQTDAANTYVTEEGATTVVENTLKNTETINKILTDTENGLGKELASKANISDIPTKTSELTNDSDFITINDVNTAIADIDLSGYQTIANISQTLTGLSEEQKAQKYPSVAAVSAAIADLDLGLTDQQIADLKALVESDGVVSQINSLKSSVDTLKGDKNTTGSVAKSIADALGDLGTGNTTVADALADKADTSAVEENAAAIATLNSGADVTGSVANTATGIVTGYAVPKPTAADCDAESNLCVLSYNTDGTLKWVAVTNPAE